MIPKFRNRRNQPVKKPCGEEIWHARSCAVVGEICLYDVHRKDWYVLIGKRGQGTPDFQGFWGLPCGYLDWNETLCEGMVREVWEECGLYLPYVSQQEGFVHSNNSVIFQEKDWDEQPWLIMDKPTGERQNLSFHFLVSFAWKGEEHPLLSFEYADKDEVEALRWEPLSQALRLEMAFSHQNYLKKMLESQNHVFQILENYNKRKI